MRILLTAGLPLLPWLLVGCESLLAQQCYELFDDQGRVIHQGVTPPFSIAWPAEPDSEQAASQARGEHLVIHRGRCKEDGAYQPQSDAKGFGLSHPANETTGTTWWSNSTSTSETGTSDEHAQEDHRETQAAPPPRHREPHAPDQARQGRGARRH